MKLRVMWKRWALYLALFSIPLILMIAAACGDDTPEPGENGEFGEPTATLPGLGEPTEPVGEPTLPGEPTEPGATTPGEPTEPGATEPGEPTEPGTPGAGDGPTDAAAIQVTEDPDLGPILTDGEGMTLYLLMADSPGESTCTDACVELWPIFSAEGEVTAGEGADEAMISTIEREDGETQVTYNDWPLYYYAADVTPGTVTGHEVEDEWGLWMAVTPEGEPAGADGEMPGDGTGDGTGDGETNGGQTPDTEPSPSTP